MHFDNLTGLSLRTSSRSIRGDGACMESKQVRHISLIFVVFGVGGRIIYGGVRNSELTVSDWLETRNHDACHCKAYCRGGCQGSSVDMNMMYVTTRRVTTGEDSQYNY